MDGMLSGVEWAWLVVGIASLLGLLEVERRRSTTGRWLVKPVASATFLGLAFAGGGLESQWGRWILLALALCFLGDVFLVPRGSTRCFMAGLASFLLGHIAFIGAFLGSGQSFSWLAWASAGVLIAGGPLIAWLRRRAPPRLAPAVLAYGLVLSAMVATAAGAVGAGRGAACLLAAILFFLSDLCVAWDRFVGSTFTARAIGLPLYYIAQWIFASTAGDA